MKNLFVLFLNVLLFATACTNDNQSNKSASPAVTEQRPDASPEEEVATETAPVPAPEAKAPVTSQPQSSARMKAPTPAPTQTPVPADASPFSKHGFSDVAALDPTIQLDIRYATANNFTKSKIYDCPRCLLRPEAAKALVKAHKALQAKGYGLKMFDCYRPGPYQQRLWDKVPDPDYVTPPAKGSMHSRGAAVDLTIVDKQGKELDMGTPYDFFGEKAHTDYTKLPSQVLTNRRLLRTTLESVGFKGIRTEWWHFSYRGKDYQLSSYVWPCDDKK